MYKPASITFAALCSLVVLLLTAGLATLLVSREAQAADVSFMYGLNQSFYRSSDASDPSYDPSMGAAFGALVFGEWAPSLSYRTGAYFAQRVTTISVGAANAHFNIGYIDLPLTLMYRFSDRYAVFAGAVPAIKTSSDCTGYMSICNADFVAEANLQAFGAQAGLNFKLGGIWSAELIYDWGLTHCNTNGFADAVTGTVMVAY